MDLTAYKCADHPDKNAVAHVWESAKEPPVLKTHALGMCDRCSDSRFAHLFETEYFCDRCALTRIFQNERHKSTTDL